MKKIQITQKNLISTIYNDPVIFFTVIMWKAQVDIFQLLNCFSSCKPRPKQIWQQKRCRFTAFHQVWKFDILNEVSASLNFTKYYIRGCLYELFLRSEILIIEINRGMQSSIKRFA